MKDMEKAVQYFQQHSPQSPLLGLYELALAKGAVVELDTMWRLSYKGNNYSANTIGELFDILERE